MKVKIIKSKLPTVWYTDKIGEVFEVNKKIDSEGMYQIKQNKIYAPSFIYAEDIEIIKDESVKAKNNLSSFDDYPDSGRTRYLNTRFDDYPYNGY